MALRCRDSSSGAPALLFGWPLVRRADAAVLSRPTWMSLVDPMANHEWQD
jgi:hypothetical protein